MRKLNPRNKGRPLRVLCDGEGFLHSQGRAGGVPAAFHLVMEDAAPKSGLEPRREVLVVASQGTAAARFADYRQKKACLTKAQYIARVRQVLGAEKAQQVAKRIASGSEKTRKGVDDKSGAAARS